MIDLFKGLEAHFIGSALDTALTGGLHYGQAPDEAVPPYGVLMSAGATPADTHTSDIDEVSVQYNLFTSAEDSNADACFTLINTCLAVFDNTEVVVWAATGISIILQRELIVPPFRTSKGEDALWQGTVEFLTLHQRTDRRT